MREQYVQVKVPLTTFLCTTRSERDRDKVVKKSIVPCSVLSRSQFTSYVFPFSSFTRGVLT